MAEKIGWNFRQMEGILADAYGIASTKRSTFSARLRHFHRLGFPIGFHPEQGKTGAYESGEVAMMTLAVEFSQLGLGPVQMIRAITTGWFPVTMALHMAASELAAKPKGFWIESNDPVDRPFSMFLFYDPEVLQPLRFEDEPDPGLDSATGTLFYGGEGVVRDGIVGWTTTETSRIVMVNVTSMLDRIAESRFDHDLGQRQQFFKEVADWVGEHQLLFESNRWESIRRFITVFLNVRVPNRRSHLDEAELTLELEGLTGLETGWLRARVDEFAAEWRRKHVDQKA